MTTPRPRTVIFYGVSGSGKGTQAKLLAKYLELEASDPHRSIYIETGSLLRGFVRTNGYTQEKTREIMDGGHLLPAFLPSYIWTSALIEQFTGSEHLVLDGLARRLSEAPVLDEALQFYGRDDFDVFVLELSDASARERLKLRHRSDDTLDETAISHKIDWYKENTEPAIAYFEQAGRRIHRINGEPSIEAIHETVLERLGITT